MNFDNNDDIINYDIFNDGDNVIINDDSINNNLQNCYEKEKQ